MKLVKNDIKLIKNEKFSEFGMFLIVLKIVTIISVFWIYSGLEYLNITRLIIVDLIVISILSYFIYLINSAYYKDLKAGYKNINRVKVLDKYFVKTFEAGSGAMYIPILGNLFPKLFNQEMREFNQTVLIIENVIYKFEGTVYEDINKDDLVEIHLAVHSQTFLQLHKCKIAL